jgi:hypothetical protein
MIITMLQGGLGNQLFQYFMGKAQAERFGTELMLDISLLRNDPMRQYNLGLFHNITDLICIGSTATVMEQGLPYNQNLVDGIEDGDVLRGYWQSEKYFQNIPTPQIFNKLMVRNTPQLYFEGAAERILQAGRASTFLTIRRTDYLKKQDFHGVLPASYYRRALSEIRRRTGIEPVVFVFSDDPDWCKENLSPEFCEYQFEVTGTYDQTTAKHLGREDLDLYLMSLCQNGVMANSSFSWWGAWLGDSEHTDRVVIAPKQWFTTTTVDGSTIVPERWVKI